VVLMVVIGGLGAIVVVVMGKFLMVIIIMILTVAISVFMIIVALLLMSMSILMLWRVYNKKLLKFSHNLRYVSLCVCLSVRISVSPHVTT
jgi:hypothetical protein